MNFRGFVVNDHEKIARMMIENPGTAWREGFGIAKPADELAAVLHYALEGFPEDGKSLTIQAPGRHGMVFDALVNIANDMEKQGLIMIDTDVIGYKYIGKPAYVKDAMRLTNRRKPELVADEEQHRAIGELLGYKKEAIDKFISRLKSK